MLARDFNLSRHFDYDVCRILISFWIHLQLLLIRVDCNYAICSTFDTVHCEGKHVPNLFCWTVKRRSKWEFITYWDLSIGIAVCSINQRRWDLQRRPTGFIRIWIDASDISCSQYKCFFFSGITTRLACDSNLSLYFDCDASWCLISWRVNL